MASCERAFSAIALRRESGVLEVGVDIIEVARVERSLRRFGDRFRQRVFTPRELLDSGDRGQSLAARFAAKEATIKALGNGRLAFKEIEIVRPEGGRPTIKLSGQAARRAKELRVTDLAVSLSHTHDLAVAMVVLSHAEHA